MCGPGQQPARPRRPPPHAHRGSIIDVYHCARGGVLCGFMSSRTVICSLADARSLYATYKKGYRPRGQQAIATYMRGAQHDAGRNIQQLAMQLAWLARPERFGGMGRSWVGGRAVRAPCARRVSASLKESPPHSKGPQAIALKAPSSSPTRSPSSALVTHRYSLPGATSTWPATYR